MLICRHLYFTGFTDPGLTTPIVSVARIAIRDLGRRRVDERTRNIFQVNQDIDNVLCYAGGLLLLYATATHHL